MRNFDFHMMGPDNRVLFFERAYKLRRNFWLDKLDCRKNVYRVRVEGATFEDAMRYHGDNCIPILFLRNTFLMRDEKPYYEVGFRKLGYETDYFLYILVDEAENGGELIEYFLQLGGKGCE